MRTSWMFWLAACGTAEATDLPDPAPDHYALAGGTVPGQGPVDIEIRDGRIVAVGVVDPQVRRIDLTGRTVLPAWIDAHVHLAYLPQGPELARAGVAGAVDWAAPIEAIRQDPKGPRVVWSGPMIAAPGGYPTTSWGRDGYGVVVTDVDSGISAVDRIYDAGGRLIKLSLGAGPDLDDAVLRAIINHAHARGMRVGVHALTDATAARAADLGADVLVHAPRAGLTPATAARWSKKFVIPTISAFGGTEATRLLREAGAVVVYGTDFGNTSVPGISESEITGMLAAGMTLDEVITAGTSAPAAAFGLDHLGSIAPGKEASLLVLPGGALTDPRALTNPTGVVFRGELVRGTW